MKARSILHNYLMNALLSVSGILFPLISFRYTTRILLPEGTGKVAMATSVIAYFSMFAELGIPAYGIRACAKVRDNRQVLTRTVHELLGINLAMAMASYALLALGLTIVPKLAEERLLYIVVSATIFMNSIGMEWLYKGLEQYTYITVRSIIFKVIALGAMFLLVHQEADYVIYGGISIFASSASNVMNYVCAGKYIDYRRPSGCDWRRHLKPVLIFFAMACATTVYTNLDALMLGFMTTDADVGYYNAAVKVKGILVSVVTALGAVLLPRSSYYVEYGQMEEFQRMTRKALRFVLFLAMPVMVYFMLFAQECILFLSGEAFLPSILPMQIIMPTVLFIGLTNILGIQMLVPLGKEKTVLKSEIVGAIVDLILNVVLIPSMKSTGAAIGTLVAEMVVLGVQYWELRKEITDFFRTYSYLKLIIALVAGTIASFWIRLLPLNSFLTLIVTSICFFATYSLVLYIRREEMVMDTIGAIKKMIRKST